MARTLIGSRIRDRRKALGTTQLALAQQVGISPSYLNLIESNRRNIGGTLLRRIADELGLGVDDFDGAVERRLVDELAEVAAALQGGPARPEPESSARLAAEHPLWAQTLVSLHRACLDRDQTIASLSDRLNQDPFLGEAVHQMLSKVTAIRSACEILEGDDALQPGQRERFLSIVSQDSRRLADVASSLAAFFDKARMRSRSITPVEEVDDLIGESENHFPSLEDAAERVRASWPAGSDDVEHALTAYLLRAHGVHVRRVPASVGAGTSATQRVAPHFDPDAHTLELPELAAGPTRRFALARLAASLACFAEVAQIVETSDLLHAPAARRKARAALIAYVAGAILMPYEAFRAEAVASRYDVGHLCRRFRVSLEQAAHRLTTLRRAGAEGVRFGFIRADASGHLSKRLALPDLAMPRYSFACPLWALHEAFQTPGQLKRQLVEFPNGTRYVFFAQTVEKARESPHGPRRLMALMLACNVLHAPAIAYADGLDLSSAAPAVPVGQTCRMCVRRGCAWRQEAPIIEDASEPAHREDSDYGALHPL
ncbi:helix-turn-helix domain-containing protein [Piscinibacter koreensis]|uniref:DUF2083 domain-containing protein n=1 Tax=Piscinibacter koreensis TaxID=2742824 RepID=A0A7Y6TXI2_9BURK|nr:helix-turn-helix transcriptional regulator [Schlegelella koreensis]NUZ07086.1 DUF2083 domain-containing protein [Schlegelella koreensis]